MCTLVHTREMMQARMYDQRLTFHPSHFVKLASLDDDYVSVSVAELELHSQVRIASPVSVYCVCFVRSVSSLTQVTH